MSKKLYPYDGRMMTAYAIASETGISYNLMSDLLKSGYSAAEAVALGRKHGTMTMERSLELFPHDTEVEVVFTESVPGVFPDMQPCIGVPYKTRIVRHGSSRTFFMVYVEGCRYPLISYPSECELYGDRWSDEQRRCWSFLADNCRLRPITR